MASCSNDAVLSDDGVQLYALSSQPNDYTTTNLDHYRRKYHEPSPEGNRVEYAAAADEIYERPLDPPKVDIIDGKRFRQTQIVAAVCILVLMVFVLIELIVLIALAGRVTDLESRLDSSEAEIVELKSEQQKESNMPINDPMDPSNDDDDDDGQVGGSNKTDEKITELEKNQDKLKENITIIRSEIASVKVTISEIQSNLISLGNDVNSNTDSLQSVQQQVTQLEANITATEEHTQTTTNDLDDLEKSVEDKFNKMDAEITSLQSNTSGNAQKLTELSGTISSVETNLGTVEGKVVQLEQSDFGTQIQSIADKQTEQEAAIADVVGRLDQVESTVDQLDGITEGNILTDLGVENADQYITDDGYIIIQQRVDNTNFDRSLSEYKTGFGTPPDGSFWLGLDTLHSLTSQNTYKLRIEVEISGSTKIAEYSDFSIGAANTYQFSIGDELTSQIGSLFKDTMDGLNFYASGDSTCSGSNRYKSGWWLTTSTFCGNINLNAPFQSVCSSNFCAKVQSTQFVQKTKMMIKLA